MAAESSTAALASKSKDKKKDKKDRSESGSKEKRNAHKSKDKSKDKSKSKSKSSSSGDHAQGKQLAAHLSQGEIESAFQTMYPVLELPIPPVWTSNPFRAFSDLMDTLVMRYVPQLSGVLVTHSPTKFLQSSARITSDSAFATVPVGFECIVWRPRVGQKLEGTITLSSPSHVSLLLYGTFNASIPASHLPASDWEFIVDSEADSTDGSNVGTDRGLGHWQSKATGERLGGESGKLSFTVISMTVANHLLSLHGSLLDDPFSVPAPTQDTAYLNSTLLDAKVLRGETAEDELAVATGSAQEAERNAPRRVRWEDDSPDEDDEDDENANEPQLDGKSNSATQPDVPPTVTKESSRASKRKSDSHATAGEEVGDTSTEKRDKKKRKKDKESGKDKTK